MPLETYDGPGILDAMASNEETGRVVYKLSPSDGVSRGRVGMLTPSLGAGNEFDVSADLLALKCPSCETKHDALKFETAMYAQTSDGANHVIFAGAALLDDINGYSYPALFKVPADSSAFLNGSGTEMYLDGSSAGVTIDSACEGMVDVNQGRFTTFTALAKRGAYGYAGTTVETRTAPTANIGQHACSCFHLTMPRETCRARLSCSTVVTVDLMRKMFGHPRWNRTKTMRMGVFCTSQLVTAQTLSLGES